MMGVRVETGVALGAKMKNTLIFDPFSPVCAISLGSSAHSAKGVS